MIQSYISQQLMQSQDSLGIFKKTIFDPLEAQVIFHEQLQVPFARRDIASAWAAILLVDVNEQLSEVQNEVEHAMRDFDDDMCVFVFSSTIDEVDETAKVKG